MIPCFFGRVCFFVGLRSLAGKRGGGCEAQKAKDVGPASIPVVKYGRTWMTNNGGSRPSGQLV